MQKTTIRLDDELLRNIEIVAEEMKFTKSETVRVLIHDALEGKLGNLVEGVNYDD